MRWAVGSFLPTRRGWAAAFLAFVLTDLGALGGNNLVVMVASVASAALLIDGAFGWANLRGLSVRRRLPEELFARTGCRGTFEVERRSYLPAYALELSDGVATAYLKELRPSSEASPVAWWRFPVRGAVSLPPTTVRSSFPFGLFQHFVLLDVPAEVLVYPCARSGRVRASRGPAQEGQSSSRKEGAGDLRDLRPYRPGDRLASIHWPTSARVGAPMVGVRCAEEDAGTVVPLPSPLREEALERATGAVLDAWARGVPVGLRGLEPALANPRRGVRWRRRLLDELATAVVQP